MRKGCLADVEFFVLKYMGELGLNFEVYRNDELTIEDVKRYFLGAHIHL
jgi:hypothetical protein